MWSAEKRAEGLEYMHPKPSSHSGRIVGYPEGIQIVTCGSVPRSRLVLERAVWQHSQIPSALDR